MTLLIIYFLLTICISAACSIFEASLLSSSATFVESSAKTSRAGKMLKFLKSNIDNSLGAILVLNAFANIIGAAAVGAQSLIVFGEAWEALVAIIMTLSILYIAEIVPKTLAALYWKRLILPLCYILIVLYYIFFPFVYVSRAMTFFIRKDSAEKISREEILSLMELGEKSGSLEELEMDILEHLLAQRKIKAKDIMTKRENIFALQSGQNLQSALKLLDKHTFSRIPLLEADSSISRLVYKKQILHANMDFRGTLSLESIAKPLRGVSENMQVLALLKQFMLKKEHLFSVVNASNQCVGIVSLEDALSAVLGVGVKDVKDMKDMRESTKSRLDSKTADSKARIDSKSAESRALKAKVDSTPNAKALESKVSKDSTSRDKTKGGAK